MYSYLADTGYVKVNVTKNIIIYSLLELAVELEACESLSIGNKLSTHSTPL